MSRSGAIAAAGGVLMAFVGLNACGSGARDRVIARVGGTAITEAAVVHWMSVMAPEHVVPDPPRYSACIARQNAITPVSRSTIEEECRQQYQALRRQALDFLISSRWLIDEARYRRLDVSEREIAERLGATEATFSQRGTTLTDSRLMVSAELASARLRQTLVNSEPTVATSAIVTYYRRHIGRFERRERRYFDILEALKDEASARTLMRQLAAGQSLPRGAFHESLERSSNAGASNEAILAAVFAARPHVPSGPVRLSNGYSVFEVTQVVPGNIQPLSRVRGAIANTLSREQQQRALSRFIAEWRRRWIARTDCQPGYVVQKCRQYDGLRAPEDPLTLD